MKIIVRTYAGVENLLKSEIEKLTNKEVRLEKRAVSFDGNTITYNLVKFRKTNQGTCINLKPIVKKNDNMVGKIRLYYY